MRRVLIMSLLLVTQGCASGAAAGGGASGSGARRSQNVITESEIAENPGLLNAQELIMRLRPNYLRVTADAGRGAEGVQLRVDNGPQREVNDLRDIDIRQVREIRYYSAQEANVRFGVDTNVPVIAIAMKRLQ